MINLSPSDLDAFISVAETGSFRRSAEQLHVSQPTISARIRHLEDALRVKLFHRTTRRVVITEAGERLRGRVERMVIETRALVKEFREEAELQRGRIVIGASPSVASGFLPSVIGAYRARWPDMEVVLVDDIFGQALERVKTGEVDLAVCPYASADKTYICDLLFTDSFQLAVPADHRLTKLDRITLADFADEKLIAMPPESAAWATFRSAYASVGQDFTPSLLTRYSSTMVSMVREKLGVGLLSGLDAKNLNMKNVVLLPVSDVDLSRNIGIVRANDREMSAAAGAFRELLIKFDVAP